MPVEDGYLHAPASDPFLKKLGAKNIGLYGLFVKPDQGEDWLIGIFEKHVLVFGTPPLDVEIVNLKDERHKTIRRHAMDEALLRLTQLQEEYKGIDHVAVYLKNRERLKDRARAEGLKGGIDLFADRGLYLHHGLHVTR